MSKRGAANYLTDQNWDQAEDEEEAGVFKQADTDTLKRRPIKKAARRKFGEDTEESESGGSTFKGFTGFTGFQKTTTAASAFSSLGSKSLLVPSGSNTVTSETTEKSITTEITKPVTTEMNKPAIFGIKKDSSDKSGPITNGNGDEASPSSTRSKYLHQLKSLNEGVSKWIKDHVDKNPYCILTPIFKDYETYLSDLDKKYPPECRENDSTENKKEEKSEKKKEETSPMKPSSFSFTGSKVKESEAFTPSTVTTTSTTTVASTFSFGASKPTSTETAGKGLFSSSTTTQSSGIFGAASSTTTSSSSSSSFSGFKFGSEGSVFGGSSGTGGFSFGAAAKTAEAVASGSADSGKEEDYIPPKEEVSVVKEDDSLYTIRCKLFFKKGEAWKEKGVGNLHLKPCGEKTQLLVRADTNLGNILLNIMLNVSLPVSRQGKNNVALVCIPNPAIDGLEENAMVPMLIRVKTGDNADELFEKLKELKGEKS